MSPRIAITQLHSCTEQQAADISRLVRQLSPRYPKAVTQAVVADVLAMPGNTLLTAVDDEGRINGILLLTTLFAVTGRKVWIEDFVVDERCRGNGLGHQLLDEAIRRAAQDGVTHLNLTARSPRVAATRLYASLGFIRQETNYYRLYLVPPNAAGQVTA